MDFPDEFDGWTKFGGDDQKAGGYPAATYRKNGEVLAVTASGLPASVFENVWDSSQEVGQATCGTSGGRTFCVREDGDKTYMASATTGDANEIANYLGKFIGAV